MKFLKTIIYATLLLLMTNCTSYRSAIITDGNDASNKSLAHYQSIQPSRTYNTIFILNGKETTSEKIEKCDNLTSVNIISDKAEIERLGYDFSEVKIIAVCESKKK